MLLYRQLFTDRKYFAGKSRELCLPTSSHSLPFMITFLSIFLDCADKLRRVVQGSCVRGHH